MQELHPVHYLIMEILTNLQIKFNDSWTYSTIFEDNNGALVLEGSPKMSPSSKHIAIKYHFFCKAILQDLAHVTPIQSAEQLADIISNGLPTETFTYLCKKLMGW